MIFRLLRLAIRLAALGAVVWLARAALKARATDSGDGWAPAAPAPSRAATAPVSVPKKSWVAPDSAGAVPATHPVKAKVASKLYRVPGMADYERVRADRCYESVEAAEADGFTRARR